MRQSNNNGRRPRGRPNRKPHGHHRNQNFDSSGPDGRIRGSANQIYEKYLALARDAGSSGDRVAAEAFYQHAEHYFRIMNESTDPESENAFGQRQNQGHRDFNGQGQQNGRQRFRDSHGPGDSPESANTSAEGSEAVPVTAAASPVEAAADAPASEPVADDPIPGLEPQPVVEDIPLPESIVAAPEPQPEEKPRRGRPRKRPAADGADAEPVKRPARRSAKKTAPEDDGEASKPEPSADGGNEGLAS